MVETGKDPIYIHQLPAGAFLTGESTLPPTALPRPRSTPFHLQVLVSRLIDLFAPRLTDASETSPFALRPGPRAALRELVNGATKAQAAWAAVVAGVKEATKDWPCDLDRARQELLVSLFDPSARRAHLCAINPKENPELMHAVRVYREHQETGATTHLALTRQFLDASREMLRSLRLVLAPGGEVCGTGPFSDVLLTPLMECLVRGTFLGPLAALQGMRNAEHRPVPPIPGVTEAPLSAEFATLLLAAPEETAGASCFAKLVAVVTDLEREYTRVGALAVFAQSALHPILTGAAPQLRDVLTSILPRLVSPEHRLPRDPSSITDLRAQLDSLASLGGLPADFYAQCHRMISVDIESLTGLTKVPPELEAQLKFSTVLFRASVLLASFEKSAGRLGVRSEEVWSATSPVYQHFVKAHSYLFLLDDQAFEQTCDALNGACDELHRAGMVRILNPLTAPERFLPNRIQETLSAARADVLEDAGISPQDVAAGTCGDIADAIARIQRVAAPLHLSPQPILARVFASDHYRESFAPWVQAIDRLWKSVRALPPGFSPRIAESDLFPERIDETLRQLKASTTRHVLSGLSLRWEAECVDWSTALARKNLVPERVVCSTPAPFLVSGEEFRSYCASLQAVHELVAALPTDSSLANPPPDALFPEAIERTIAGLRSALADAEEQRRKEGEFLDAQLTELWWQEFGGERHRPERVLSYTEIDTRQSRLRKVLQEQGIRVPAPEREIVLADPLAFCTGSALVFDLYVDSLSGAFQRFKTSARAIVAFAESPAAFAPQNLEATTRKLAEGRH